MNKMNKMNNTFFAGLILFLILPTVTQALRSRECSKFQAGFRGALEDATGKICDEIEEGDLENLTALDLEDRDLFNFHPAEEEVFEKYLQKLHSLNLSNNQIRDLPLEIWEMRDLEELNISGNPVWSVPWGLVRKLRRLERLDWSQTNILSSVDHNNRMAVITPGEIYKTGAATRWENCFFPCWDNYAYIQTSDKSFRLYECAGDEHDSECGFIARRWEEDLRAGNRLLLLTSGSLIEHIQVLTGSPQNLSPPPERGIHPSASSFNSQPECAGADGFPFDSYKECSWNSGIEKCFFENHQGEVDWCIRTLKSGKTVEWLSAEHCRVPGVCPWTWNQEWYRNGGSIKPGIPVILGLGL